MIPYIQKFLLAKFELIKFLQVIEIWGENRNNKVCSDQLWFLQLIYKAFIA